MDKNRQNSPRRSTNVQLRLECRINIITFKFRTGCSLYQSWYHKWYKTHSPSRNIKFPQDLFVQDCISLFSLVCILFICWLFHFEFHPPLFALCYRCGSRISVPAGVRGYRKTRECCRTTPGPSPPHSCHLSCRLLPPMDSSPEIL